MAKKVTTPAENEVDQVVDQVIETTEAVSEAAPQGSPVALNVPKPEPVQAGYHSRDFGRTENRYEATVEQPSESAQDGGQEEAQV